MDLLGPRITIYCTFRFVDELMKELTVSDDITNKQIFIDRSMIIGNTLQMMINIKREQ